MEQQIHHIRGIRYGDIPARVIVLLRLRPQRTAGHRDQHIDATPKAPLKMQRHTGTTPDAMRVGRKLDRPQQPIADSRTERLKSPRIRFA